MLYCTECNVENEEEEQEAERAEPYVRILLNIISVECVCYGTI